MCSVVRVIWLQEVYLHWLLWKHTVIIVFLSSPNITLTIPCKHLLILSQQSYNCSPRNVPMATAAVCFKTSPNRSACFQYTAPDTMGTDPACLHYCEKWPTTALWSTAGLFNPTGTCRSACQDHLVITWRAVRVLGSRGGQRLRAGNWNNYLIAFIELSVIGNPWKGPMLLFS